MVITFPAHVCVAHVFRTASQGSATVGAGVGVVPDVMAVELEVDGGGGEGLVPPGQPETGESIHKLSTPRYC